MAKNYSTDELLTLYAAMLQADSAPMRRVAVWELGRLGDSRGAAHLLDAIVRDPDWECRHYAIMALANTGGEAEADFLRGLLAGDYLSQDGACAAGPIPEALVAHLAEDIEYSARCCAGEHPRPTDDEGQHGKWWRGESGAPTPSAPPPP
ncbi:MAG: HEAT repeat domain-containing protein [Armatimonadetes bacterium]|nr:HEAT repeat domain-containing protein [Armatimonadota bacterium]